MRGTTRDRGRCADIEAAEAEAFVGDPDRVATISPALDHVSVAFILLGSATGPHEEIAALHTTRLQMLLARMLDTTVRGIVYEAAGSVGASLLQDGAERVQAACEGSLIPYVLLRADPSEHRSWLKAATTAHDDILRA